MIWVLVGYRPGKLNLVIENILVSDLSEECDGLMPKRKWQLKRYKNPGIRVILFQLV